MQPLLLFFHILWASALTLSPALNGAVGITVRHETNRRSISDSSTFVNISLSDPAALKVPPIIDPNASSVIFPIMPGIDMTHLAPVFSTADGVVVSPPSGTVVDLQAGVEYVLSSNDVSTATWSFKAVEMRSPVLPGFYADPNIAIFGGTYYIYATTDGFPGWGGNVFYVWKSPDLVSWTRSKEPILTLDGAKGTVPWATGNAWAPTITSRDGKYYFYFSGNNPTYDRKTIGAAVADSPEGPFVAQPTAMILNNEALITNQAIDPDAFLDPVTGKYYILWGNGKPLIAELNDDMVSINQNTIAAITGLTDFREGIFIVYRKGLYHITYSIDDTGSENYRVGYATSTSVHGPWTYRGVVLQKNVKYGILATGHDSMVNVPGTDHWYMAYHRFGIPNGDGTHRETTIDRCYFDAGGFMQPIVPTLTSVGPELIRRRSNEFSTYD